ncbi:MAG: NAD(P)/FAD-dependent oxidoreductase [Candidatus Heimdallarchaeota archaeon]|nr:NAD(P)/FAD-dependent oxidoreductase [Candidatus Heimdallarchaeota archaeon]
MFERPTVPDINCDVVIIGAGVAGITAAKALKEGGVDVWLLGSHYESQIAKAGALRNVTLIPQGTIGLDHIEVMEKEAIDVGVSRKTSLSTGIEIDGDKVIVTTKMQKFRCNKVLIATGAKQQKLEFPGEEEFFHKGISDCAVCDFPLYRNKVVGVLGNHEYTIRAAEILLKNTQGVHLFWYNKTDLPLVSEGVKIYNGVDKIQAFGSETLESVTVTTNGIDEKIEIEGLFVEGNPVPNTGFLQQGQIRLTDGFVEVDEKFLTSERNILAVGDVTGKTSSFDEAFTDALEVAKIILSA